MFLVTDKNESLELFQKCLEASIGGNIHVSLVQKRFRDGKPVGESELYDRILRSARPTFRIANGYMHLEIEFSDGSSVDMKSVLHSYRQYLDKADKTFRANLEDEIFYIIDVIGVLEEQYYRITAINPLFLGAYENAVSMVFPLDDSVAYGEVEGDFKKLLAEADSEEEYARFGR